MTYLVKEVFYTLQGEGANTGRPSVFLRFAGCNLWSGREEDRTSAICDFCDTDFIGTDGPGGGRYATAQELVNDVQAKWPTAGGDHRFVVCTGGEPLLQLDTNLIEALRQAGFAIAVETNGTLHVPKGIDWICVSPKVRAALLQTQGDELKIVFPQPGLDPSRYEGLAFQHFFLQPMDGPHRDHNTTLAMQYCLSHPTWRLSLQTHKLLGIP